MTRVHNNAALFELKYNRDTSGFQLTRTIHLPAKRYSHLAISPDGNYAGFVQYQFVEGGGAADFKIVDLQVANDEVEVIPRTLFSVTGLSRFFHFLSPTWVQ